MYTTDVLKMYAECIQNVCHISTNFCIHFVYKIKKTMPAKFYIQNVYKSLSKCGTHFVYNYCAYILYTPILMYIKVYIINTMYTICIQNLYRMYVQGHVEKT